MVGLVVLSIETIFDISYTTDREYDRKKKFISNAICNTFHVLTSQFLHRVMRLWRHQQSIVTQSAACKQSWWDTESMCKVGPFTIMYGPTM